MAKDAVKTQSNDVPEPKVRLKTALIGSNEFFELNKDAICKLVHLGVLKTSLIDCRDANVGNSNYSEHLIQPWSIWQDWNLNPWDADIVKRVLRTKQGESRRMDYEKIIHICQERIRQIDNGLN